MIDESLTQFQTRFARDLIGTDLPLPSAFGPGYAIHARNVRNSLLTALGQSFPATARLAGLPRFDRLARDFTLHHPPRLGWISAYGAELPDFLALQACCAPLPYLADIARIEWARVKASFAKEAAGLDLTTLASMPPDDLMERRISLHPSATLISSPYPVYAIWADYQNSCDETTMVAPDFEGNGDHLLVSRAADGQAAVMRLPRVDGSFIAALAAGQSLGKAWAAALDIDRHFDLAAVLAELVREGAFAAGTQKLQDAVRGHDLDNPTPGQGLDAVPIVAAADELDDEIQIAGFIRELEPSIGPIAEGVFVPAPALADALEDGLGTGTVGNMSSGQIDHQQPAIGIDGNASLAPVHLLARVKPALFCPGRLERLAVDDARDQASTRCRGSPGRGTCPRDQP